MAAVDLDAVWDYLAYRYVPAPATLFRGIHKLMPGTFAVWEHGRLTHTRYWAPPDRDGTGRSRADTDPVRELPGAARGGR